MTDSMNIPTGLGRVGKELAVGLQRRGHEIGYLGWFQNGDANPMPPPGIRFWHTNNNQYGLDLFDHVVNRFQPDIVLTVGDFWNLWYMSDPGTCKTRRWFQWCAYIPVDGEPVCGGLPPSIKATVEDIDIPVAYTDYAKDAVMKTVFDQETRNRIRTIYHGVDTSVFKPANLADRKKLREQYGINDKFVFLTVSRNQSRKNIPELFRAWKRFSETAAAKGNVLLWPHMNFNDPMGWKIGDLLQVLDLKNQSIMYYDQVAYAASEMQLIPDEELAKLYQIADAFVLLSGEGFGLPTFEAMATGLPCILLDYASSSELGANGRAELVPATGSITWTGAHLTQRPVPAIDDVVAAMQKVFSNGEHRRKIAKAGQEFATQYTWDRVLDEWNMLFLEHEMPFIKPKRMEVVA